MSSMASNHDDNNNNKSDSGKDAKKPAASTSAKDAPRKFIETGSVKKTLKSEPRLSSDVPSRKSPPVASLPQKKRPPPPADKKSRKKRSKKAPPFAAHDPSAAEFLSIGGAGRGRLESDFKSSFAPNIIAKALGSEIEQGRKSPENETPEERRLRKNRINERRKRARRTMKIDFLTEQFHNLTRENDQIRDENETLRQQIAAIRAKQSSATPGSDLTSETASISQGSAALLEAYGSTRSSMQGTVSTAVPSSGSQSSAPLAQTETGQQQQQLIQLLLQNQNLPQNAAVGLNLNGTTPLYQLLQLNSGHGASQPPVQQVDYQQLNTNHAASQPPVQQVDYQSSQAAASVLNGPTSNLLSFLSAVLSRHVNPTLPQGHPNQLATGSLGNLQWQQQQLLLHQHQQQQQQPLYYAQSSAPNATATSFVNPQQEFIGQHRQLTNEQGFQQRQVLGESDNNFNSLLLAGLQQFANGCSQPSQQQQRHQHQHQHQHHGHQGSFVALLNQLQGTDTLSWLHSNLQNTPDGNRQGGNSCSQSGRRL